MGGGSGVAISPSGQYLYVASLINLYQFDLWSSNVASTMDTVGISDTVSYLIPGLHAYFAFLQLGPDNKIYGVGPNTAFIHVINQPDLGGDSCNVVNRHLDINFPNGFFMPNHPHYRMPAMSCDTTPLSNIAVKSAESYIQVYPNPTDNLLMIESNVLFADNSTVEIYNSLGQLVEILNINTDAQKVTVDASSLLDGVYIMRIKNGDNMMTRSFVVSKK